MTRFDRQFLQERLNGRVHLAAFGKHPAWDDHIEDLGLGTDSLVLAKQTIYSLGITKLLASGEWDRLETHGYAVPFDHRFVWSRGRHSLLGAIWSSADGKGRARFPMVVCVQAEVGSLLAIRLYLEPIEAFAERCRAVADREAIVRLLAETCVELNSAQFAARFVPDPPPSDASARHEAAVLNGLLAATGAVDQPGRNLDHHLGVHCRLPAISTSTRENLRFWSGYVERRSTRTTLVIASAKGGFVDLIVNEPQSADLFCLRAGLQGLPATQPANHLRKSRRLRWQCEDFLRSWRLGRSAVWKPRATWWQSMLRF
jgi:hypothetical protein